ncbi:MAG: putative peptidase [Neolewinella sp.]|jgi:predicted peptidase
MRKILASAFAAAFAVAANLTVSPRQPVQDPAPGTQVEQSLKSGSNSIDYHLYLPKDYRASGEKVPLMLFLHGRGESNGPLSVVAKWGPPRRLAAGEQMKYIVVSPQCPPESFWSKDVQQTRLVTLLKHIRNTYNVDDDRIYLTGLSMGGFGTWQLAASHPDFFAAVAPICGRGDPDDAKKLRELPIWAWHGTEDTAVPFRHSVAMVDAIKAVGGTKIRFTSLEHIGHASWQAAYQSDDLYKWFDRHKASTNKTASKAGAPKKQKGDDKQ